MAPSCLCLLALSLQSFLLWLSVFFSLYFLSFLSSSYSSLDSQEPYGSRNVWRHSFSEDKTARLRCTVAWVLHIVGCSSTRWLQIVFKLRSCQIISSIIWNLSFDDDVKANAMSRSFISAHNDPLSYRIYWPVCPCALSTWSVGLGLLILPALCDGDVINASNDRRNPCLRKCKLELLPK